MGEPITPYKGRDADAVINAALKLYEEGIEISDAAEKLGVPARTIHRWLATNAEDKWHEAQKGRALSDFEQSRKRRDQAREILESLKQDLKNEGIGEAAERNWRLAHAREVLRAADTDLDHHKWLMERLLRRIYGDNGNISVSGEQLADMLMRVSSRMLQEKQVEALPGDNK